MMGELLGFVLEIICGVAEMLGDTFVQKTLGWIGVGTALLLTWGRVNWEIDEWRSILLGGVVMMVGGGLLLAGFLHHATTTL